MSYIQTGGTFNVRGGEYHTGPMLNMSDPNSSFSMIGGTINFTAVTTDDSILVIKSQVGNYNVTGGTVNINLPNSANANQVVSTVPFYNLNIINQSGTGAMTVVWNSTAGGSLTAVNNLSIGSNTVLNLSTHAMNLAVGGDFTIASGVPIYPVQPARRRLMERLLKTFTIPGRLPVVRCIILRFRIHR